MSRRQDPALSVGGRSIELDGPFGQSQGGTEGRGSGQRGHKRKVCEEPISKDPEFSDGLQWPG